MEFDDFVTLKAFVVALQQLQSPLPLALQLQINEIVAGLPESSYELPEVAASFAPFDQVYQTALYQVIQENGTEGERLKFAELPTGANGKPESEEWTELVQQLSEQLTRLENGDESDEAEPELLSRYLYFLVQQVEEHPEMLVPYTPEMSAEIDDLLKDVVLE